MFLVVLTIANFFNIKINGKCCKENPLVVNDDGVDVGGSNNDEPEPKPQPKSTKKDELKNKLINLLANYGKLKNKSGILIDIKPEQIDETADEKLPELEKKIYDLITTVNQKLADEGTSPEPIDNFKDKRNDLINKLKNIKTKYESLTDKTVVTINIDEDNINKAKETELQNIEDQLNGLDNKIDEQLNKEKTTPDKGIPPIKDTGGPTLPAGGPAVPGSKASLDNVKTIKELNGTFKMAGLCSNFNKKTKVDYKGKQYEKNILLNEANIKGDKFTYDESTDLSVDEYREILKTFLIT